MSLLNNIDEVAEKVDLQNLLGANVKKYISNISPHQLVPNIVEFKGEVIESATLGWYYANSSLTKVICFCIGGSFKPIIDEEYCHSAYVQYTSCEMLGWMSHKLESRLLEEISMTSDMQ